MIRDQRARKPRPTDRLCLWVLASQPDLLDLVSSENVSFRGSNFVPLRCSLVERVAFSMVVIERPIMARK